MPNKAVSSSDNELLTAEGGFGLSHPAAARPQLGFIRERFCKLSLGVESQRYSDRGWPDYRPTLTAQTMDAVDLPEGLANALKGSRCLRFIA